MRYIVSAPCARLYKTAKRQELADCVFHGFCVEVDNSGFATTEYGYSGFIEDTGLTAAGYIPNAIVRRAAADVTIAPDIRSPVIFTLYCGSKVFVAESAGVSGEYRRVILASGEAGYTRKDTIAPIGLESLNRGAGTIRINIINAAKVFLRCQYRWGGKSIDGIDCSGLVWVAYYINGITVWRDAVIKEGYAIRPIPISAARAADLLYFPGHVGICLGDGRVIHSSYKNNGVAITPLHKMPAPTGAGSAIALYIAPHDKSFNA